MSCCTLGREEGREFDIHARFARMNIKFPGFSCRPQSQIHQLDSQGLAPQNAELFTPKNIGAGGDVSEKPQLKLRDKRIIQV
jgi:hypothetical protein